MKPSGGSQSHTALSHSLGNKLDFMIGFPANLVCAEPKVSGLGGLLRAGLHHAP
jgi:hypothetical protein